jgi:cyclic pyranopterin monophosphate synthase
MSDRPPTPPRLTHLDEEGRARMVDVGDKPVTSRVAVAEGHLRTAPKR